MARDTLVASWTWEERPENSMIEPWASVDDVAKHLGIARDTVYRWIEAKGLPAHRVGRLWKFKLGEVDEWVRQGGAEERGLKRTGE